jgi:hypothetical protein
MTVTRFINLWAVRLMVAALLATIGLQAASPASALELTHGSAFSAATYEVALVKRSEPVRLLVAPLPLVPPEAGVSWSYITQVDFAAPLRTATSAPLLTVHHRLPEPRAPPAP